MSEFNFNDLGGDFNESYMEYVAEECERCISLYPELETEITKAYQEIDENEAPGQVLSTVRSLVQNYLNLIDELDLALRLPLRYRLKLALFDLRVQYSESYVARYSVSSTLGIISAVGILASASEIESNPQLSLGIAALSLVGMTFAFSHKPKLEVVN